MKHLLTIISLLLAAYSQPLAAANKTVLLDNFYNHEVDKNGNVYHYTWDDTSWGGFYILGNMIRNSGYGLSTLTTAPTMEALSQCQAYIIVDPDNEKDSPKPNYMDAASAKVIAQWVKQGGRLLVFANDNQNCDIQHINILMSLFGISFNDNSILNIDIPDSKNPVLTDTLQGSIPGAEKFYMRGTCSISCKGKNAKPLVWTRQKETVMAQASYGKGSVIAIADPFIYNEYIGHVLVSDNVDNATGARYLVNFMTGSAAGTEALLAESTTWTREDVTSLITTVNGYWQSHNKAETRSFWDPAAYHTGNIEAYKVTGNMDQLAYSIRWAEYNHWKGATEPDPAKWQYKQYGEDKQHVLFGDWQICFQTFIDLYNINKAGLSALGTTVSATAFPTLSGSQLPATDYTSLMVARAKEVMGYEAHSKAHDYWWWADALYMVMPVMTKMYKLTGDEIYLDKLYENICYSDSIMLDTETGLYFRDGKYIYPKHKSANGKKDFWARGDGWVLAGLAKVLQDMPETYQHYAFFRDKYIRLAKAVAALQQPEGYWTRSMADPDHAPGPETSGTAFFTYGMLWGINNGLLSKDEFRPVINRAWNYLTTTVLQLDGEVGYVQPIGERAIPGQTVGAHSQANFGVGAYLLAAAEYYRMLEK